jgi:ABC-type transport system substrate-binding protein
VLGDERYFRAINRPGAAKQIGFFGWGLDYVSASTLIQPTFTCASLAERDRVNVSNFCDRPLDRLVERALAAQGSQAAATWAAADRRVVDRAAVVPMTNHRGVVFVSERVGNVQHHLLCPRCSISSGCGKAVWARQ